MAVLALILHVHSSSCNSFLSVCVSTAFTVSDTHLYDDDDDDDDDGDDDSTSVHILNK